MAEIQKKYWQKKHQDPTTTLDATSYQKQHTIKLPQIWRVLLQCNSASGKINADKVPRIHYRPIINQPNSISVWYLIKNGVEETKGDDTNTEGNFDLGGVWSCMRFFLPVAATSGRSGYGRVVVRQGGCRGARGAIAVIELRVLLINLLGFWLHWEMWDRPLLRQLPWVRK